MGLLFMIFLLVSTLCLLCTVIAKGASVSVKRIRESIGGEIYIRPTQNSIVEQQMRAMISKSLSDSLFLLFCFKAAMIL